MESEILEINLEDDEEMFENRSVKSENQTDDFFVGREVEEEQNSDRKDAEFSKRCKNWENPSKKSKYDDSKSVNTIRMDQSYWRKIDSFFDLCRKENGQEEFQWANDLNFKAGLGNDLTRRGHMFL